MSHGIHFVEGDLKVHGFTLIFNIHPFFSKFNDAFDEVCKWMNNFSNALQGIPLLIHTGIMVNAVLAKLGPRR